MYSSIRRISGNLFKLRFIYPRRHYHYYHFSYRTSQLGHRSPTDIQFPRLEAACIHRKTAALTRSSINLDGGRPTLRLLIHDLLENFSTLTTINFSWYMAHLLPYRRGIRLTMSLILVLPLISLFLS